MSTSLTDPAPSGGEEVSVVTEAPPAAAGEVVEGSAVVPEGYVETSRFNGLMGRLNKEVNERQRLENELASLRQAPNEENVTQVAEPNSDPRYETLLQRNEQLLEMLLGQQVETARAQVFNDYPAAKPFAELIQADSPDDFRALAETISGIVEGLTPQQAAEALEQVTQEAPTSGATQAPAAQEAPTAPITGGGAPLVNTDLQDRVSAAKEKGDWSEYFAAKFELADATGQLEHDNE